MFQEITIILYVDLESPSEAKTEVEHLTEQEFAHPNTSTYV